MPGRPQRQGSPASPPPRASEGPRREGSSGRALPADATLPSGGAWRPPASLQAPGSRTERRGPSGRGRVSAGTIHEGPRCPPRGRRPALFLESLRPRRPQGCGNGARRVGARRLLAGPERPSSGREAAEKRRLATPRQGSTARRAYSAAPRPSAGLPPSPPAPKAAPTPEGRVPTYGRPPLRLPGGLVPRRSPRCARPAPGRSLANGVTPRPDT